ncbi:MAG: hypothetical protein J0H08_06410 [Rhizobiales bacterium]|nr:hypothetical protein [Hyphomicrobiales bacterium]
MMRQCLAAALFAASCAVALPSQAAGDPDIVFKVEAGDHADYAVRYIRGASLGGRPNIVTAVSYDLGVDIKSVTPEAIIATVTTTAVDVSVNGQRVLDPPDFDSALYLAAEGIPIDVSITPDGTVGDVQDWDALKATLETRLLEKAGKNEAIRATAHDFFGSLGAAPAAEVFARPLALSAAGRIVKLSSPDRRSVEAKGVALPSFTSAAKGNWTFTLIDAPTASRLPGAVTIEWLGVPNAEDLRAILRSVAAQFSEIDPESAPALAVIERDARMWQRFLSSYAPETGQLIEMSGQMELVAGPIQRKVAIEARRKPQ